MKICGVKSANSETKEWQVSFVIRLKMLQLKAELAKNEKIYI